MKQTVRVYRTTMHSFATCKLDAFKMLKIKGVKELQSCPSCDLQTGRVNCTNCITAWNLFFALRWIFKRLILLIKL